MKLLYLYVETWPQRGISKKNPIEVNFDCGYKFHYDPDTNALSCEQREELPKGFFSVSSENGCVDSVSVIIGDNGTGKTTIASVLGYLFQRGRHLPEYICIYQENQKLVIYWHFEDNRAAPDRTSIKGEWVDAESNPEYTDVLKHNCPFDIVYYSPYFIDNEIWRGENLVGMVRNVNLPLFDVSTGNLALHSTRTDKGVDRITAFLAEDQLRILCFAHEYVNTFGTGKIGQRKEESCKEETCGPVLPRPIYAQLLVETFTVTQFLESPIVSKMPEVQEVVCNQDCNNPAWQLVSKLLICISTAQIDDEHREQAEQYRRVLIEICRKIQKTSVQSVNEDQFAELQNYVKGVKGNVALKAVLMKLLRVYGKSVLNRSGKGLILYGQVGISDNNDYDDIIDVQRSMPKLESELAHLIGRHESLMKVELANMSSGEMAYWTLFARLYDVFRNKMPKDDKRDILLFLDEAETTLHPVWQQQLVRNVIWFLEKYLNEETKDDEPRRRVHVIFATHSPMILSDVPKGNVAFLIKDRQDSTGKMILDEDDMRKLLGEVNDTFGANVFDMYYRLFFLTENGGRFSTDKMQNVVEKIHRILVDKKFVTLSDEDWWLLDHAGDPQVQKYFDSVKPLIQNAMK